MHSKFNSIINKFDIRKQNNDKSYQAICPAHEDSNPSLSITLDKDKILLYCHAGCSLEAILNKVGLAQNDLVLNESPSRPKLQKKVYDYLDAAGNKVHSTIKSYKNGKKQFRQVAYQNGKEVHSLKGIKTIIYNLPEVTKAVKSGGPVYIVEGEKDADALIKSGLTATTNPMGAGKWKKDYSKYFRDADVIIIPDNDKPGKDHAKNIANSLIEKANSIKIIYLPDLDKSQDVTDWLLSKEHTTEELLRLVEDTVLYGKEEADDDNEKYSKFSEAWFGEKFASKYHKITKYNHTNNKWYIWNGIIWVIDNQKKINELAKELICEEIREFKDVSGHIRNCSNASKRHMIHSMLGIACSDPKIRTNEYEFDSHPLIYALNNGYYNLELHNFIESDPELLISKKAQIDYDCNAECPNWEKFLELISNGEPSFSKFLQTLVGYSLQGMVTEEILIFIYGTGSNGKSIFFWVLEKILGDHFQKMPTSGIILKKNETNSKDIARLYGVRLAVVGEWPDNTKMNDAKVKELTGGDRLVARFLYNEYFEFTPSHTLWIYGNHKPMIPNVDNGIWRRIKLIPFLKTIPEKEQKPRNKVMDDFKAELPGILNWALEGHRIYKEDGIIIPEFIKEANLEFKEESNAVIDFINQKCEKGSYTVKAVDLYTAYESWTGENKEPSMNNRQFYKLIREMDFQEFKMSQGNYKAFRGIQVKSERSD